MQAMQIVLDYMPLYNVQAELLAVEGQLVSDSKLPSHRLARYEGHVWKQHRVKQAPPDVKDKK